MKCHFEKWVFGMMNGGTQIFSIYKTGECLHDKMVNSHSQSNKINVEKEFHQMRIHTLDAANDDDDSDSDNNHIAITVKTNNEHTTKTI